MTDTEPTRERTQDGGRSSRTAAATQTGPDDVVVTSPSPAWLLPDHDVVSRATTPRPRLLEPEGYCPEATDPPQIGWQRLAFRLGIPIQPGKREVLHRDWRRLIRQPLTTPTVIIVFSPKGGVGKSTTALGLGHVLAMTRGDLVAALDANPDTGNLVKRLPEPHSVLSANDLHRDSSNLRQYSDLLPYLTQGESGLCVIRSDPDACERPAPGEYQQLLKALSTFFSLIIVDLGIGIREPSFLGILDVADAVVAVTQPAFDCAEVVAEGLEWLRLWYPAKIGAGTLVINEIGRRAATERLIADLGKFMTNVRRIPADRHLAVGGVVNWRLLARQTQDAYLELAATVIDALPGQSTQPGGQQAKAIAGYVSANG
jgi:MinD-like ATPase involved in chromosome partitioning or flagellar assembly